MRVPNLLHRHLRHRTDTHAKVCQGGESIYLAAIEHDVRTARSHKLETHFARKQLKRNVAGNRADRSVQRELAYEQRTIEGLRRNLT